MLLTYKKICWDIHAVCALRAQVSFEPGPRNGAYARAPAAEVGARRGGWRVLKPFTDSTVSHQEPGQISKRATSN
eukprot:1715911-Pleurochrysis_carterae.AAC.1